MTIMRITISHQHRRKVYYRRLIMIGQSQSSIQKRSTRSWRPLGILRMFNQILPQKRKYLTNLINIILLYLIILLQEKSRSLSPKLNP
ncbi:hypothetical protein [Manitoba virus]|uniref:Uncharacterized protein n=1 Tax=Manitoba virus TaxID=1272949 RepID=A0A0D3R1E4_9RHAB|nr:hypothetical protein [Manitoba virus]AJR28473.1 hypothetical protein [Manitoba virus]